jgi:TRAP-type C4-dicarboxylate transport system permease large subunit
VVAAGGTLGILIPPSVVMVIYGILTETSIGSLFIAGIVPGLFLAALMITYVVLESMRAGTAKPLTIRVTWSERFGSLTGIWPVLLLFLVVMGSIYSGLATTTEAAALGALGDPAGLSAILSATEDKATVRRRAVIALAPFDGPEVDAALKRATNDRDWQVRQAAEDLSP